MRTTFIHSIANLFIFISIISFTTSSIAQRTSTSLSIQPVSIALVPQIKCKNFEPSDSAKAVEYSKRFSQLYRQVFDSLSKANPGFVFVEKKAKPADLQLTFQMNYVPSKGQGFKDFYGRFKQDFWVFNNNTQKRVFKMSISSHGFTGFHEHYYQQVASFTKEKFLKSFLNNFAPFSSLLHPNKRPATHQVILQKFTVKDKKLKPVALRLNHLVNNTLALYQNKNISDTTTKESVFIHDFAYTPQYRLKKQTPLSAYNQPVVILGTLVHKDKTHYELQLKFVGDNVSMKLYDSTVKTSLLLHKDLIDAGNYSEAILEVTKNFQVFIFSNYR